MKILYTKFGKSALVEVEQWHNTTPGDYEIVLWVERGEDYYALMSPQLKDKKVAVVHRRDWLKAVNNLDIML